MSNHTPSPAVAAPALGSRILAPAGRVLLFAALLWGAAAAGEIPIPGTPVPITLQTFVVMLAALTLNWREAGASVTLYLLAGAAGLPVFAGGASTAALVGPSAGFLIGFLPGVIVTALLKGSADSRGNGSRSGAAAALRLARLFFAALIGCVAVVYAFGILVQSAFTGAPILAVTLASMGFVAGDVVKAVVATLVAAGVARLSR
ncbi:biotin transporter BioY [Bifidobacterium vespertilionis]|uniref:Biotin transporter n=1 Tax=Bifidobacterium vespertilionis TaxID=2562524 RepID=A0A5J5E1Q5_9BIFI|nr:biotin transporter BioY [Bifidobacterium vespertilionis]KAA8818392.1 biotin transporter BioY [Bifidobacterium vespertilionis]KAA8822872.1 biotin transporter BioY [Bifidobacterium vespertilionis]